MAGIDSLLKLVRQQGANELRLAVDQAPQMFAFGTPKRLSVPATSEQTLRSLLGSILSPEQERLLRERGSHETNYEAGALGAYRVTLSVLAAGGFSVVFVEGAAPAAEPAPASEPAARETDPAPAAAPQSTGPRLSAKLVDWLQRAAAARASDLHLAEGERPWLRVDGALKPLQSEVIDDLPGLLSLSAAQVERLARRESIDAALSVPGAGRVRLHVYGTDSGLVAALRLLLRAAPAFSALNMPCAFDDLIDLPHGLVLVCGAAGSGKSTTLAALAQEALHRHSLMLVTLEDPLEYELTPSATSLVRRRQVGRDVPDFAAGLRDALRADPNLLLIGEIRDPETTQLALSAAETGHLVLASLHSRSAASAIERMIDACPAQQQQQVRVQLAESLRAVVAQRLLRRRHAPGRVPAIELLRVNRAVATLIREAKTAQIASVLQSSGREGMLVLERSLADRVQAGEIHLEDAYAAANDPETLTILLKR